MNEIPQKDRLLRNLKDAGCDETVIETYFRLQKEGRRQEQFRLLAMHKAALLERLHVSQQMIDCLDYLVYTMKKEMRKEQEK